MSIFYDRDRAAGKYIKECGFSHIRSADDRHYWFTHIFNYLSLHSILHFLKSASSVRAEIIILISTDHCIQQILPA